MLKMMKEIKELLEINPNIENIWVNEDNTIWYLFEPFTEKMVDDEIVQERLDGFEKLTREEILDKFKKLTKKEILKDGIK